MKRHLILLCLVGCTNGANDGLETTVGPAYMITPPTVYSESWRLCPTVWEWGLPLLNADGTTIEPGELDTLTIYGEGDITWTKNDVPVYEHRVQQWIADPYTLLYEDTILEGTWSFYATLTNIEGQESDASNVINKECLAP